MNEEARMINFDELDKLLYLYKHLHPEDPVPDSEKLAQVWNGFFSDTGLFCFVIEKNNLLVSSCTLAIIKNLTRGARPFGVIENVITLEDHRNKGFGTSVLKKAVEFAREKNCYKVMLMTGSKSDKTLKFYESAGFSKSIKTAFVKTL